MFCFVGVACARLLEVLLRLPRAALLFLAHREERLQTLGLLGVHLLHLVERSKRRIELRLHDWVSAQNKLHPRVECELIKRKVPQQGLQREFEN